MLEFIGACAIVYFIYKLFFDKNSDIEITLTDDDGKEWFHYSSKEREIDDDEDSEQKN